MTTLIREMNQKWERKKPAPISRTHSPQKKHGQYRDSCTLKHVAASHCALHVIIGESGEDQECCIHREVRFSSRSLLRDRREIHPGRSKEQHRCHSRGLQPRCSGKMDVRRNHQQASHSFDNVDGRIPSRSRARIVDSKELVHDATSFAKGELAI